MRVAPVIVLSNDERAELARLADANLANPRLAKRACIVLLAAQGMQNKEIAEKLTVGRVQVSRWRKRYLESRLPGIEQDLPRGAPATKVDVARLVHMTTLSAPEIGPCWSTRMMAAAMGISPASVSRHWRANSLKPKAPAVELQRNTKSMRNFEGIAGLYQAQAIRAIALYGHATGSERPHTAGAIIAKRDGINLDIPPLFDALHALNEQDFTVDSAAPPQVQWLKFLRRIDREISADRTLIILTDNHALNVHPSVLKWLISHPRAHIYTGDADQAWLVSVVQVLGDIDPQRLHSQATASTPSLVKLITDRITDPSPHKGPFIWTCGARTMHIEGSDTSSQPAKPGLKPLAGTMQPRAKARPISRLSGNGDTLRDNVINLKHERILHEAAMLFFERGYLQTSVDAIAERLGATKPFIYYHFNSKVEILVEICEKSNLEVLAAAKSAMSVQGSPRVRFEQFLRDFTNVALQQHQHVAIYFREEISLPKESSERIKQMRKSINMLLTALLMEGVNTGDFQIEDPRMAALVIAGMSSYAFAWYRENGRLDQQEVTNRIVEMALKLVSAPPFHRPTYRVHSATHT